MKLASNSDKAKEGHFGLDVESKLGKDYINDMNWCLEYALGNRLQMINEVNNILSIYSEGCGEYDNLINKNHNHAEFVDGLWIHRKGATQAPAGMMGVIPGNMEDGSFIVKGKGNPESLYSSSHGAGRIMGRGAAKRNLNLEDFEERMAKSGIQATVCQSTLDESKEAYKNIFDVMDDQKDLLDIVDYVFPIISIKDRGNDRKKKR
jgi:tRNA-splicing ligase RtcB (3'-phosphate/5'-hydroxy nucleic acid ligase)